MTDQELDKMMRRVLCDAIQLDCESANEPEASFIPSRRHQQQMQAMLKKPLTWIERKTRPLWKQVLQRVAVILLVASVAFGGVMAISPTARAEVVRWVVEWYETHIVFRYAGEDRTEEMPQYTVENLPDGYTEVERIINHSVVNVLYENSAGEVIFLDYNYIHEGGSIVFAPASDDMDEVVSVAVGRHSGLLFIPKDPDAMLTITWIDETENIQFVLTADLDDEALLRMAECVKK